MGVRIELVEVLEKVLRNTDAATPEDIAAEIFRHITIESYAEVCQVLLREWVRVEMGRSRAARRSVASIAAKTQAALTTLPSHSPKVTAIRAAAPGWLRDRVHVGGRRWKMIQDCTVSDLKYLATMRHESAQRSLVIASDYERLAALLQEHDAREVGKLPPDVLAAFDVNR